MAELAPPRTGGGLGQLPCFSYAEAYKINLSKAHKRLNLQWGPLAFRLYFSMGLLSRNRSILCGNWNGCTEKYTPHRYTGVSVLLNII